MLYNVLIILLISFACANLQKQLMNILALNDNIFYVTNEKIHNSINNLFYSLKLNQNFTKNGNKVLLLQMHSDCNDVAEKIYKIYGKVSKISKHYDTKTSYTVEKLHQLVRDILNEITLNNDTEPTSETQLNNNNMEIESDKIHDEDLNIETKLDNKDPESEINLNENNLKEIIDENYTNDTAIISSYEFTDDDVSLDFVKDFLTKINKLSIYDLIKSTINGTEVYLETQTTPKPSTTTWHPWISSEEPDVANRRIYKGKSAKIKTYSFIASIHVSNEFVCAGSILSRDLIITAASCLQVVYANKQIQHKVYVRLGSDYSKFFGLKKSIKEVLFHPKYNPLNLHHNLAILKTATKISFDSKKKISKINYDKIAGPLTEDVDYVTMLGWGDKSEISDSTKNHKLSYAKLVLYNIQGCREIYTRDYVSLSNFCAGFVTKGSGACNRDAGGPGLVDGLLTGVVSFGSPKCGKPDAPTVFTKLGYYADWIDSVVDETEQEYYKIRQQTTLKNNMQITPMQKTVEHTMVTPNSIDENIFIFRDILLELTQFNDTVNDILYNEPEDDFNENMFKTTKDVDIFHHPLLNRSLFIFADVEDLTTKSTTENFNSWVSLISPTTTVITTEFTMPTIQESVPRIRVENQGLNKNNLKSTRFETLHPKNNNNKAHRTRFETLLSTVNKNKVLSTRFEKLHPKNNNNAHKTTIETRYSTIPKREMTTETSPFYKTYVKYFTKHGKSSPKYLKYTKTKLI